MLLDVNLGTKPVRFLMLDLERLSKLELLLSLGQWNQLHIMLRMMLSRHDGG